MSLCLQVGVTVGERLQRPQPEKLKQRLWFAQTRVTDGPTGRFSRKSFRKVISTRDNASSIQAVRAQIFEYVSLSPLTCAIRLTAIQHDVVKKRVRARQTAQRIEPDANLPIIPTQALSLHRRGCHGGCSGSPSPSGN